MKKWIICFCAMIGMIGFVGCETAQVQPKQSDVSDFINSKTVEIKYYSGGTTTEWIVSGDELENIKEWISGLQYEEVEFEQGHTPGDNDGGEVYDFVLSDEDDTNFSYIVNGETESYFLVDSTWFAVKNPSKPPVDAEDSIVRFHDKILKSSDLSEETLGWLSWYNELPEEDQLAVSFIPPELYDLCGYPFVEDVTAVQANDE